MNVLKRHAKPSVAVVNPAADRKVQEPLVVDPRALAVVADLPELEKVVPAGAADGLGGKD